MYSRPSKLFTFLFLFAACVISSLEAARWGKNEQIVELEGVKWNEVCFDTDKLYFVAYIPNFDGTRFQDGFVSLNGIIDDNFRYMITSSAYPSFMPPQTVEEFVELIQEANPDFQVKAIDFQELDVKFAVDLIPKDQASSIHWRFLATNGHLIQMGTDDPNGERRAYFFESFTL
jgi:hypothetical protein